MAQLPEQKKEYLVVKDFKGINTQSNRTAIDDSEFAWLENVQPVGFGNLKVTPAQAAVLTGANVAVSFSNTVTYFASANINLSDYIVAFEANGGAEYFNLTSNTFGTIASAGKFSGANVSTSQWKNERLLIADPQKGLFTWDGNNVVSVGSVGQIALSNVGSGYTSAPSVTISAPNDSNGVQATAIASLTSTTSASTISSIVITNAGSGYSAPPSVTIAGGGGTGGAAVASLISFIPGTVGVTVEAGGTGYTSAPAVAFSGGGGANAAATAIVLGGQVTNVVMTNLGTGYTSAPTVTFSGGGGSGAIAIAQTNTNPVSGVASFSGRVWVSQGRTVYYSAANQYNDFITVSAGAVALTDSTLHGNIYALLSANNFLYIFGDDSINVFSDVQVQTTGSTIFTNTNVSASVGTRRTLSIFPYFRSVMFLNDYGVYALVGSTTTKLSPQLDGIFPLIDFTQPVSANQVLLNGSLCAAFNFYYNDPLSTERPIQAVFFDKKWFITSQGTIKYITGVPLGGVPTLYGTDGTSLYKLYGGGTSNVNSTVKTALWQLGDPIRTKQATKFAVEATTTSVTTITATVDSEIGSSPTYNVASNVVLWVNNSQQVVNWLNNVLNVVTWASPGYSLYRSDAAQWGKYIGLTITSGYFGITYNTLELEYEKRARF
jgi:hypothetical protein